MIAHSGHKNYGPLTIAVQTKMNVKLALNVKNTSFKPRPKVDSSVVILTPLITPMNVGDPKYFERIVKICFSQRRKTLANNLKSLIQDKNVRESILSELGVDLKIRPEQLSIEQFIRLAKLIKEIHK